jgi:hypothetical protein
VTKLKSESKCGEKISNYFPPKFGKKFRAKAIFGQTDRIFPIYLDFSHFGEISHPKKSWIQRIFMKIDGNIS